MQFEVIDTSGDVRTTFVRENFSSLEWLVIAIGAQDESVPLQWSAIGRSLLALFGGAPQPLASPCLEALRRMASVARHYGWSMPAADVGAFLHAGWNEAQLERLIDSVCPEEEEPHRFARPLDPRSRPAADRRRKTCVHEPLQPAMTPALAVECLAKSKTTLALAPG